MVLTKLSAPCKTRILTYESNYANTKVNLNFADLFTILSNDHVSKGDFAASAQSLMDNIDESYDEFSQLIPGVQMRYHPFTTSTHDTAAGNILRAVEFNSDVKNVNIDYKNTSHNISNAYKGGVLADSSANIPGTKVVLANDNAYNSSTTYSNFANFALDVSGLSVSNQNAINGSGNIRTIYYSADNTSSKTLVNNTAFYFGTTGYKGNPDIDYTNASREDLGNARIENPGADVSSYLQKRTDITRSKID